MGVRGQEERGWSGSRSKSRGAGAGAGRRAWGDAEGVGRADAGCSRWVSGARRLLGWLGAQAAAAGVGDEWRRAACVMSLLLGV